MILAHWHHKRKSLVLKSTSLDHRAVEKQEWSKKLLDTLDLDLHFNKAYFTLIVCKMTRLKRLEIK